MEKIKIEEKKIAEELIAERKANEEEKVAEQNESFVDERSNVYFRKFIQLKRYLKQSEEKFVNLEQENLKSIKQVYALLTGEQKLRLIRKFKN